MEGSEKTITDQLVGGADKAGDKAGKESGKGFMSGWKGIVTAAAAAGLGAAFMSAFSGQIEKGDALNKLNATLDLTGPEAERAGAVAGNLYSAGMGEGMGDVTTAVDAVMSSMSGMRNASEADLEAITGQAMALADGFGVDVTEAVSTAGVMMNNGLAPDAEAAMDLITASMQNVPAAMRGEILPVMDEYSKHFAGLGIDGPQALGLIVAASENGAIGMDKMGDSLKEFQVRAGNLDDTGAQEAMEGLGLNAEKMASQISKGGPAAQDAMSQVVGALQKIEDPGEQAAAAIALFGAPLEDMGIDTIPAFLDSLSGVPGGMGDVNGAAAEFTAQMQSGPGVALDQLQRAVSAAFGSFLTVAMPAIQGLAGFISENHWVIGALATAIAVVLVPAMIGWVAQIWAANAALLANPITWIVVAIGALVAAIIWVATQTTFFQDVWAAVWGFIQSAIAAAGAFIQSVLTAISAWWTVTWTRIQATAAAVWSGITTLIGGAINGVRSVIQSVLTAIGAWWLTKWTQIRATASAVWSGIRTLIGGAINGVRSVIQSVLSAISSAWSSVWNAVRSVAASIWSAITGVIRNGITGARSVIQSVLSAISSVWRSVWSGIQSVARSIWSGITGTIRNAISGVRSIISSVLGAIRGVWSSGWNGIKSLASSAWRGITGVFSGAVGWFRSTFGGIANAIRGPFISAFNGVARAWNNTVGSFSFTVPGWVPGVGGKGWSAPKIPMLATGGVVTKPTLAVIGEGAESEAVLPLSVLDRMLATGGAPEPSGGGGMVVQGPLVQLSDVRMDSDNRVKQLSQDLWNRANRGNRARGRIDLGGATA
ncbi:MAG: hypothetical protein QJR09_05240 [Micrococcus sp.]|nr:hypothetical protein [Micrococcus sp.]